MKPGRFSQERAIIRGLAERVSEIAGSAENATIQRRWRDVNALRRPDRAPVWCRPVGAWAEILPDGVLECTDRWLRAVETSLRRTLIKHDIGDDHPVSPWWLVQAAFDVDPPNTWGVDVAPLPGNRMLAVGRHGMNHPHSDDAWFPGKPQQGMFLKVLTDDLEDTFSVNVADAVPYAVAWRGERCVIVGMAESDKTPTKNALVGKHAGGLDAYLMVADFPP